MQFNDYVNTKGHLTIIKKDIKTKKEQTLFDDHNIIVSGMGATIANVMQTKCDVYGDCVKIDVNKLDLDINIPGSDGGWKSCKTFSGDIVSGSPSTNNNENGDGVIKENGKKISEDIDLTCFTLPYKIIYFQLGDGGTSSLEVENTYQMGRPLDEKEYGERPALLHTKNLPIGTNGEKIETQTLVDIIDQAPRGYNGLVSYIILDETTCNGVHLNEISLFSKDPFLKYPPQDIAHMVAYRNFNTIVKDNSFEIIIRWIIYFGNNC